MTTDATDGRRWLCPDFKTGGKFLHSAFCILHSSGALRRVERVERGEGNRGVVAVFDSEGVTNFSLRKWVALGWAASGNANRNRTASQASELFAGAWASRIYAGATLGLDRSRRRVRSLPKG